MEYITKFIAEYGGTLGGIGIAGVVLLGILKYCNVFKKLEENARHACYLGISVGTSTLGSLIYLLVTKTFEFDLFFALIVAIYSLNQAFYSIFKNTTLSDLIAKLLDKLINKLDDPQINSENTSSK